MISPALQMLRSELTTYLRDDRREPGLNIELGNIGTVSDDERVLLSLVSVEEEAALKNVSPYQRTAAGFELVNPPVFLNLFVLITPCSTHYETALRRLAWIIQCFQQKPQLTPATNAETGFQLDAESMRLRLSLDLYPMSFEKANQLWTVFGGKQLPSALYKIRLVEEQGPDIQSTASPIIQITTQFGAEVPTAA